jgi:hypothetical protein
VTGTACPEPFIGATTTEAIPMTRTPIPSAELASDLNQLGQAATVIQHALSDLLLIRQLPAGSLPSLHAAKRSAQSLVTFLDASTTLAGVGR